MALRARRTLYRAKVETERYYVRGCDLWTRDMNAGYRDIELALSVVIGQWMCGKQYSLNM